MSERRAKVDTVQIAVDGFKSHQKLSVQTSVSIWPTKHFSLDETLTVKNDNYN